MKANWFVYALMALDLGASICYFGQGDIRRGIYWFAALVLTATVSY